MTSFCRFELRARNVPDALAFYASVLSARPAELETEGIQIVAMPESMPRHVPAHWLGHLLVDALDGVLGRWLECGGTQLGAVRKYASGHAVTVRDPGGATVVLTTQPHAPTATRVLWHQLDSKDPSGAASCYGKVFGWRFTEQFGLEAIRGRLFAFGAESEETGAILDLSERPDVHPHWVFHFRVPALETALQCVRARGGTVLTVMELPKVGRFAVCDDPEGGGFGLRQA